LSPAEIRGIPREIIKQCFSLGDKRALANEGACLPLELGVDQSNGRAIQLRYYCSDICPNYGVIGAYYANVSEAECDSVGGGASFDPAHGGYRGCRPVP